MDLIRKILTQSLQSLTGKKRYQPVIEWSDSLWTHNIFRTFELLFGREYGIRLETSVIAERNEDGTQNQWHYAHTFEGACALFEVAVRELFAWRPAPIRIYIPVMQTPQGIPVPMSPYLFAIAFDVVATGSATGTSLTYAHTNTGSDRYLGQSVATHVSVGAVSGVTYNSTAQTLIGGHDGSNNTRIQLWGKEAPSTGSNNVVVSKAGSSAIRAMSYSFTGVNQTTPVDASAVSALTTLTTFQPSVTASVTDCVGILAFVATSGVNPTDGTNTSHQTPEVTAFGQAIARNTNPVSGTTVQIVLTSSSQGYAGVLAALAPASSAVPQAVTANIDVLGTIAVKKTFKRTLTAAAGTTASITMKKTFKRTLTALTDAASTIASANLRFLTLTANLVSSSSIVTESINAVLLTANLAIGASITLKKTFKRTLSAAAEVVGTTTPLFVKLVTLTASIRTSATVQGVKTFYQTLTASITAASTVTRGSVVKTVILSAILSVKGSLGEYFYKRKYTKEDEDYKRKY